MCLSQAGGFSVLPQASHVAPRTARQVQGDEMRALRRRKGCEVRGADLITCLMGFLHVLAMPPDIPCMVLRITAGNKGQIPLGTPCKRRAENSHSRTHCPLLLLDLECVAQTARVRGDVPPGPLPAQPHPCPRLTATFTTSPATLLEGLTCPTPLLPHRTHSSW